MDQQHRPTHRRLTRAEVRRRRRSRAIRRVAGLTAVVPFLVEDSLKEAGARYSKGPDGDNYVVTDGTLVTGQNPASSADAARRLLDLLTH